MNIYEAMKMAEEGHRIRRAAWNEGVYIRFYGNKITAMNGDSAAELTARDCIETDWEVLAKKSAPNTSTWKRVNDGQSIVATVPNRELSPSEVVHYGGQVICESVEEGNAERIIECCNLLKELPIEEVRKVKAVFTKNWFELANLLNDIERSTKKEDTINYIGALREALGIH